MESPNPVKLLLKFTNYDVRNWYASQASSVDPDGYMLFNTGQDSGFDLYIPTDVIVPAGSRGFLIDLGVICQPADQHGYWLTARSSLSKTPLRVSNSIGLIDYGYRGRLMLAVDNISEQDYTVQAGQRLAQLVMPDLRAFQIMEVPELNKTARGSGGFGSTGK